MLGTQRLTIRPKLLRVIDAWDYLNERCFDGEMIRPRIVVWAKLFMQVKKNKIDLNGAYDKDKNTIWLRYGIEDMLGTLYHEMCHQYKTEVLLDDAGGDHGKVFYEVYEEGIRRLLRLSVGDGRYMRKE